MKIDLDWKEILIFGMGISGEKSLELLSARGSSAVYCVDQNKSKIKGLKNGLTVEEALLKIPKINLMVLSPGISKKHPLVEAAIGNNVPVCSEIELAFQMMISKDIPIVAVTGTNGKTTTVSLIKDLAINNGYKPFVGGNIGLPFAQFVIDEDTYDFIILELSSFQLESIDTFRPNVAVIINLSMNHHERYSCLDEYAQAKFNITKNMQEGDFLIYKDNLELLKDWAISHKKLNLIPYNQQTVCNELSKLDLNEFKLKGTHNQENLYVALKVCKLLNIKIKDISKTILEFEGVHFRIQEIVPEKIFNDSKSTNFDSTYQAIKTVAKQKRKLKLIFGGQKRGGFFDKGSYQQFLNSIKNLVSEIYLIGETTDQLAALWKDQMVLTKVYTFQNLNLEVADDELLLFSPGHPSFDQFTNYIDRGKCFNKLFGL